MKKLTSLILCIVLTVLALSAMTVAAAADTTEGGTETVCDATLKGIQSSTDGKSLRIVGEIANLAEYREVGFVLTYRAEEKTVAASYVFNNLTEANESGETEVVLTAAEGCYLFAFIIEEIPANAVTLGVTPYTVSLAGDRVTGEGQTLFKTGDGAFDYYANHTHTLTESTMQATEGPLPVWFCSVCGNLFADANGEVALPEANVQCASDKIVTKLNAHECYFLAVWNPNEEEGDFRVDNGEGTWHTVVGGKVAPKAWTLFSLPYAEATYGNNYTYYNGASVDPDANGWSVRVFGYLNADAVATAVQNVTDAIGALTLGSLTPADEAAVTNARALYNALTDYAKAQLPADGAERLAAAEAEIIVAKDKAAAYAVTARIEALTDESTSEDVIAAKNAYDKLTETQKGYVTSETLVKLNAQIARVEEEVAAADAAAFKAKADALGTPVFPRDIDIINALAAEWNTLSEKAKAKLDETKAKLDTYTATAAKYVSLTVTFGSDRIMSTFSGYDEYYLVIYNPTGADVAFYYAGNASSWAAVGATTLKAGSYTQIVYDLRFVEQGNAYLYGGGQTMNFTGNSEAWAGWTCKVYGYTDVEGAKTAAKAVTDAIEALNVGALTLADKDAVVAARTKYNALTKYGKTLISDETLAKLVAAEKEIAALAPDTPTVEVVLSVGGTTDDPTYGKVLSGNVTEGYFSAWGYMKRAQLEALAAYGDVHFYIYNPSGVDVYFFFQEDKGWTSLDRTCLKAGEWTKVSLSAVLSSLPDGANGVYVDVEKGTEGIVLEGWKITDFYGTK